MIERADALLGAGGKTNWLVAPLLRVAAVLALATSLLVVAPAPAYAATVTISFSAAASPTAESGVHPVTVVLETDDGPTADEITVEVGTSGGTADLDDDYTLGTTTLTFQAGTTDGAERAATINITSDDLVEPNETIILDLTVDTAPGDSVSIEAPATHTVTITNDDNAPVGVPDSYQVSEGGTLVTNAGSGVLANDTDPDPFPSLSAVLNTGPNDHQGGFTLNSNGSFIYDHDGSAAAADSFTYRASDGTNQSAVTTASITINNVAPVVDAGADPAPVAEGQEVPLNATFTDPGRSDTHTATIDWGDGPADDCSTEACTVTFSQGSGNGTVTGAHRYDTAGVYTVVVSVSDGDDVGVDSLTVTVTNPNVIVTADPQTVDEGDPVTFVAGFIDSDGRGRHEATINWGDGSPIESCPAQCTIVGNNGIGTVTGTHVYADDGAYPVVVTVFDPSGDTGSGGATVTVENVAPQASITGPTEANEGTRVSLTGRQEDPGADTFTWAWRVTRNGSFFTSATTKNLRITLPDDGRYQFRLIVTDDDGGVSSPAFHVIDVANVKPVVEITDLDRNPLPDSSTGGEEGATFRLRSVITDPGDEDFTYDWKIRLFGAVVATSSTDRINYVPTEQGTFFVSLDVTDGDGGGDTDSVLIVIENASPVIERIDFDATPAIGVNASLAVHFSDPGTSDSHVTSVNWGEGSAQSSSGASPRSFNHTYNSGATRSARVCVTDDDGGRSCETFFVNPGVSFALTSDFDGDGFEDLPIGVPGEDGFGAVSVLYGAGGRLTSSGDDLWRQGADGIAETGEAGDAFGSVLAWGDFDLDGFDDLAVGAPGEDIGGEANVGIVHVLYGSASGLTADRDRTFHQDSIGIFGGNQPGDRFGGSLAAGDFNGDGFADLAVGVPKEDTAGVKNSGRVALLFGSPSGLRARGDESWDQDEPGVIGTNKKGDKLGHALAAGDFDRDGAWDLAIGIPGKDAGGDSNSGAVLVLGGSILGLDATADQWWHQDVGTIRDATEPKDKFGSVLEAGDFNGDGRHDLAVGIPHEDLAGRSNAGAVAVMLSAGGGLTHVGNTFWHEDISGIRGATEAADRFGFALAAGDFNADGRDDLAVGIPFQDVDGRRNAGDVAVLLGGGSGLQAGGNQRWNENSPGIKGKSKAADHLGWALRAFDEQADGDGDLAIGIPDQNLAGKGNAGAVLVLRGRPGGITGAGDSYWHQDKTGVRDATGARDRFGRAL